MLAQVFRARWLALCLARANLHARYSNTVLGVGWALFQPVAATAAIVLVFAHPSLVPAKGAAYALVLFANLTAWLLFAGSGQAVSRAFHGQSWLIQNVPFPRLALPIAAIAPSMLDAVPATLVLAVVCTARAGVGILALPAVAALLVCLAFGIGLLLAVAMLEFPDLQVVANYVFLGLFVATPVVYPASLLRGRLASVLAWNPVEVALETFRACLGLSAWPGPARLAAATAACLLAPVAGLLAFGAIEKRLADRI